MQLREERDEARNHETHKTSSSENQNDGENSGNDPNKNSTELGKDDRKIKKLELSIFNGDDPYGWTFKANPYFNINQYVEEEMVEVAAVCMEGRALNCGFDANNDGDRVQEEFEACTAPLKELRDELLMGIFMNGLKDEIRAKLRLNKPNVLVDLIEQAHCIKEKKLGFRQNSTQI
ncbi:hypothetical protein Pint_35539 [Pistacia integerrima]|uniref:Uncharacterized protein n=1 Tax=Pistacia integerrima TaxID=434235 RepID=A0ACC0Y1P9_9ROSI|nr:hypothetical protein Pint_35539 [Pistacia integerrima]